MFGPGAARQCAACHPGMQLARRESEARLGSVRASGGLDAPRRRSMVPGEGQAQARRGPVSGMIRPAPNV
eukprot:11538510-Alexandrium_andersonii.AAC.1